MNRPFIILLSVVLIISMAGCRGETVVESTVPMTEVTVVALPSEISDVTEPSFESEPVIEAYSLDGYEFVYDEERDRAWEEDVISLAQTVLGKHPLVYEDCHWYYTSDDWSQFYMAENIYYDVELRNDFISRIYELIERIPEMSDAAIQYELRRIVALLNDAHSSLFWVQGDMFPLQLKVLYEGGEPGIYVVKVPEKYADLLYTRLVSINGVPVKEIVYGLMDYVSSENEYLASLRVIDHRYNSVMMWVDSLHAAGVLEEGECTAQITCRNGNGELIDVTMDAVSYVEYTEMKAVSGIFTAEEYLGCSEDAEPYYWYSRIEDANTYYLRVSSFTNREDYPFDTFFNDIMLQLYDVEEPQKVIIDLRGNGGGKVLWQGVNHFFTRLDGANTDGVYILLDELSGSASVIMSCQIREAVDDAVIVGTPAGQPPNFFTGQVYETLPNSGLGFQISAYYAVTWKDYEYDALMPDITVYQTLDDYKNGVDTVLEYVMGIGE